MRYPACLLLPLTLTVASLRAADAPVTPAPSAKNHVGAAVPVTAQVDLFNGKSVPAWNYVVTPATDITKACQVKDGMLIVSGKPNGYFEIPAMRENYKLHVEWRWTTSNRNNNSGILLNISSGPVQQNTWPTSFQVQTKTGRAGDILPMGAAQCAELPPAPATAVDRKADSSEKPFGEWNACDITVRGDTIECTINGVLQNKISKCTPGSGKIGFQLEGYPYELRNLRLTPLDAEKPATPKTN